jgi:hypothetical protein
MIKKVGYIFIEFSTERSLFFSDEQIDQSWNLIRCDLQEILINPHHHINHERFVSLFVFSSSLRDNILQFIYPEPPIITQNSSLSLPIYQLKALNFIKQRNYCLSMIFGMV